MIIYPCATLVGPTPAVLAGPTPALSAPTKIPDTKWLSPSPTEVPGGPSSKVQSIAIKTTAIIHNILMRSPPPMIPHHAIADSNCNRHFIMVNGPCSDIEPATKPIHVQLPDGKTIASTHTGLSNLLSLLLAAHQAHLFPDLTSSLLLSIGQLCDAGCTALFKHTTITIHSTMTVLATGHRAPKCLWSNKLFTRSAPLITPLTPILTMTRLQAHLSTLAHQTASNCIAFLHAAVGYPVPSTWLSAI
jgi:hypothetical protein